MCPVLFNCCGIPIFSYYFFLFLGIAVCSLLADRKAVRYRLSIGFGPVSGIICLLGGLVGARITAVIIEKGVTGLWNPEALINGGLVSYGGYISATAPLMLYYYLCGIPVLDALDIVGPLVLLGEAIARIGCYLNGCCWGAQTTLPWGVCYPSTTYGAFNQHVEQGLIGAEAPFSLPVHPAPLYACVVLTALFFVADSARWKFHATGMRMALACSFYALYRFPMEFLRADNPTLWVGLNRPQIFALVLLAGSLTFLFLRRLPKSSAPAMNPAHASDDS